MPIAANYANNLKPQIGLGTNSFPNQPDDLLNLDPFNPLFSKEQYYTSQRGYKRISVPSITSHSREHEPTPPLKTSRHYNNENTTYSLTGADDYLFKNLQRLLEHTV